MASDIQILPSGQIDKAKWDACVDAADNGLIYSRSVYLDHLCDNWSGLVIGNYKAVMALPWRKKCGIRYLYQPAFIQQLGLIGNNLIPLEKITAFARYGDVLLNFGNATLAKQCNAIPKNNLVLDLSTGSEFIHAGYKKDLQLNLRKAEKDSLRVSASTDFALAVKTYKSLYQQRIDALHDADLDKFSRLLHHLAGEGMCFTRKVEDAAGEILSIAVFLKDDKRIYNIMNATTAEGRAKEANHYLLNAVITEYAGQPLLFDFEGSDIPGIKAFYEKFGAVQQPYFLYHYNRLPFFLRLFKK